MKHLLFLLLAFSINTSLFAQVSDNIILITDDSGNLKFEAKNQQKQIESNQITNWLNALPNDVIGEIVYSNPKVGDVKYKASVPIFLSKKESVYQTKMHFTILVHDNSTIELCNIYYKSIPEYGKQGTPSVTSYPSDWFSKSKFYKKSGKTRWLNQTLKDNTIKMANKLLQSSEEFSH